MQMNSSVTFLTIHTIPLRCVCNSPAKTQWFEFWSIWTSWSDQNDLTTVLLRFCVVGFHVWALLLRKQFCSNLCCSAQRNILRLYIAICKTLEFCSTAELDISTDWKLCNTCDKLWMLAITGWHWPSRTDPAAPLVTTPFSSTPPTNCNKMNYFMKSDL